MVDYMMWMSRDWDPSYLAEVFSGDFDDMSELWSSNIGDQELVSEVEKMEKYQPIVEDISMDDEELCSVVETIESE